MDNFVFVLVFGVILGIIVSMIPFIDFLSILLKVFPAKAPSDIKVYRSFINSNSYQHHKSKWKKIFILVPVVYAIVYCVISIIFDNILLGFYVALITSALYFGIAGNIEYKQRKLLISESKER